LGSAYNNRIKGERAENIENAIAAYDAALQVYTREAFPQNWAMTQNNLGVAYNYRIKGERAENIENAIAAYNAALRIYTREAFPQNWAMTQNNLGSAYNNRIKRERAENIEYAIAACNAALQVYTREAFPQDWAMTQTALGNAYYFRIKGERSENIENTIAAYNAALQVRTREAFPQDWAATQNNLGLAYTDRIKGERAENIENAIAACNAALQVRTREAFSQDWAGAQNNLGGAYYFRIKGERAENIENAIAAYNAALQVYTREAFPQDWAGRQYNLGLAYNNRIKGERTENIESAINAYKQAIDTTEFLRSQIISGDEAKQKLAEEYNRFYIGIVKAYLELGKINEALEYAERSKTRNLVELILNRDSKAIFPDAVVTKLAQLRDEIATGQDEIQQGTAENPKALAQHLDNLRQQQNELQDKYLPVGYGFNLKQFQATLDENTGIIQWYITFSGLETFIISRNNLQQLHISQNNNLDALIDWFNDYLKAYRKQVNTEWKDTLLSRLEQLAKILQIEDIVNLIPENCSRLILIPHRYLHLLPLHILPLANGKLLCERFSNNVSYAPSCQILQQIKTRQRQNSQSIFAIQNPTQDLNFADLEVETILTLFPTNHVLRRNEATKDAILQQMPKLKEVNYLHFSCHGLFNFNSPQDSCLLLSKSLDDNKNLTLSDLFERNFQLDNCRLVVLSACETGLVDFKNTSDEYISLPSGFLLAGSTSVVSSLWKVDDASTALLMLKFYQSLQANLSVTQALNQAQIWLRNVNVQELLTIGETLPTARTRRILRLYLKDLQLDSKPFESPYFWAAFCAIGN
jgi:CHAT domain-containing protein